MSTANNNSNIKKKLKKNFKKLYRNKLKIIIILNINW